MSLDTIDGLAAFGSALRAAKRAFAARPADCAITMRRIARVMLGIPDIRDDSNLAAACGALASVADEKLADTSNILSEAIRAACAATQGERAVVLIVDDDPVTVQLLQLRLRSPSREVLVATSATQAIELLNQRMISLVILDLGLPDMDGREVLAEIRLHLPQPVPPVIVLSSTDDPHVKAECIALCADEYLVKPVDGDVLTTAVSAKLQRISEIGRKLRHDPLTGVLNRMSLREMYHRHSALMARTESALSLAVLDLDHFKSVNDTYGHATGDNVLRQTAAVLGKTVRESDVVARWGGEEFVVLFPGATCANAAKSLKNAADALTQHKFAAADGRNFKVTFSAGVAQVPPESAMEAVFEIADRLLYRAKSLGRNRIIAASDAA